MSKSALIWVFKLLGTLLVSVLLWVFFIGVPTSGYTNTGARFEDFVYGDANGGFNRVLQETWNENSLNNGKDTNTLNTLWANTKKSGNKSYYAFF